ncbi:hypothetical protein [Hwanghaeella sp.]|uniref:hypothetical protein n=1 Tax=Hwanghaeella sp. TaxID=2605943 RepID=UPI003CCBBBE8
MKFGLKSVLAAVVLLVAGCETHVEVPSYARITFNHLPPITLDVATVTAKSLYQKPLIAPNVEHEFPVDIAKTVEGWVPGRLRAEGAAGTATLTVIDASVVETKLDKETGLTGLVTTDQGHRYDATLTATLSAEDLTSQRAAEATVTVKRSQTVPEDATFNEREKIWYEMTEKLMADFNTEMEKAIGEHMALFRR